MNMQSANTIYLKIRINYSVPVFGGDIAIHKINNAYELIFR